MGGQQKKRSMNVAILTGRGGSSLKDKNIRRIRGLPVLAYPCMAANRSGIFEHAFCSSDDPNILSAALNYGFRSIERPPELADDNAKHVDVIEHALTTLKNVYGITPDVVTVLMANSATITSDQLKDAAKNLENDEGATACCPVVQNQDHHPLRARYVEDGLLKGYISNQGPVSSNRQELPDNYFFTHSFWMLRLKEGCMQFDDSSSPWTFMGCKTIPLRVDYSVDIHDLEDIAITEKWLIDNFEL